MENYIVNIIWKILLAYYIYLSKLFIVLCSCESCDMLILNKSDATGHRWGDIISLHSGRSSMLTLAWLTAPTIGMESCRREDRRVKVPKFLIVIFRAHYRSKVCTTLQIIYSFMEAN